MAGVRGSKINGRRSFPRTISSRPIPWRGQVKMGIVVGLANSFASIFSLSSSAVDELLSLSEETAFVANREKRTTATMRTTARRGEIHGGSYGRLIPKRGRVMLGILAGILHTLSSVFSVTARCVHFS
ncbi:hypothetical protein L6164_036585 [Bauhinia variegata]|uniref:Uncharacterized protein n=1 Tax=Bauhinia variegata TaxID=167791 RepID=A0ACB9KHI2_BAUVA|nr:hypothetical protein L6164_036585 [Bauhinia variegata]